MSLPFWTYRCFASLLTITVTGLFPFTTSIVHAGISYCGPVGYKYTRIFQWQMDYTDKQGRNHKQVKEEKKVFDSEWYICLGGTMLGSAGMFDGENMQQDYSYSEIDNWLDQKTSTDGAKSGKKHNNLSLSEGQQGYMGGSLLLDCPEGNQLPGKQCQYTLNLTFGTGYVFQTNQETFEPPANFTMSTPLVFSRQVLLTDKSVGNGWSVEDSLSRDIKVEEHSDECLMVLRQPHIDNCSYEEKETASWDLKRIRGPCDPYISSFKGDVTINGKPASEIVSLTKGDVIKTGAHSRAQVVVGRDQEYWFGPDSVFTMVDPCQEGQRSSDAKVSTLLLIGGTLYAKLGISNRFYVGYPGMAGVRGGDPDIDLDSIFALGNYFLGSRNAMAAGLLEDFPTLGTRVAEVIFSLKAIPDEKVTVEVFKGSVLVMNNRDSRQMVVGADQTVSSWEDGSALEDLIITNEPE